MRVALLYADAFARGGYPRDARWLAGALGRAGANVVVFGTLGALPQTDGLGQQTTLESWSNLPIKATGFDIVHVFGLFSLAHPLVAMACAARGVRLIISPLAHLLPFHMAIKRHKKELFLRTAWMPWIGRVSTFHVFSHVEEYSVRTWVPKAKLFEGTLGIFPSRAGCGTARRRPRVPGVRHLVFFGRNDIYQKGLDILLEAYASTLRLLGSHAADSVMLTIAGQPWNGSTRYLSGCVRRLGIESSVTMLGEVDESTKSRLLKDADYLIFLSRWDGPPRPIREAIAAGTPVIVTPESNMGELVEKFGAGLQVTLTIDRVAKGLLRAVLDDKLLERSLQGVKHLQSHLAWDRVAEDYIRGYSDTLCKC